MNKFFRSHEEADKFFIDERRFKRALLVVAGIATAIVVIIAALRRLG